MLQRREFWFAVIAAAAVLVGGGYVALSARGDDSFTTTQPSAQGEILGAFAGEATATVAPPAGSATAAASASPSTTGSPTPTPTPGAPATQVASTSTPSAAPPAPVPPAAPALPGFIVFLDDEDPAGGRVAVVSRGNPGGARDVTSTRCSRVYFAGGSGVCLVERGATTITNVAQMLNARLQPVGEFPAAGLPSRARVAASGRTGVMTLFVTGDSYAGSAFSTRTFIIDIAAKQWTHNLESFTFYRDGKSFLQADFNIWGVTFLPDPNRFYATLGTGGRHYLVEGDIAARSARVIFEGVECPSLSPDGTRIAFKSRNPDNRSWRLAVLDLRTMTARTIESEQRNFDDQAEWLDNDRLIYGMPAGASRWDIWTVPADGSAAPQLLIPHAFSPAVVREAASLSR